MDKNKLVKIISVTTGTILIGVIIYYVVEKEMKKMGEALQGIEDSIDNN